MASTMLLKKRSVSDLKRPTVRKFKNYCKGSTQIVGRVYRMQSLAVSHSFNLGLQSEAGQSLVARIGARTRQGGRLRPTIPDSVNFLLKPQFPGYQTSPCDKNACWAAYNLNGPDNLAYRHSEQIYNGRKKCFLDTGEIKRIVFYYNILV